jgi:phosphoribosylamine--glycine ligase
LPLLESDLLKIMMACTNGTLSDVDVKFSDKAACCVIMASAGYPKAYESGFEIVVDPDITAEVYFAGAKESDGKLVTAGGRVLGVTSVSDTLEGAINDAYKNVALVNFKGAHYRKDIGKRAMSATR